MVGGSTRRRAIAMAAMATALAFPAAAAASGPGVDEYTLNIPGAGGNHPLGGGPPGPVQAQLSGPQGSLLGAVATSPALGAPRGSGRSGGGRPGGSTGSSGGQASPSTSTGGSFTGAALRTAGDGSSLFLLGGIVALGALASGSVLRLRTR